MDKDIKDVWINCDCFSPEHSFRLTLFKCEIDGTNDLYASVHLNKYSFWKRIWTGIKYIFGYQCQYGVFDEFIIGPENAKKIKEVCEEYLKLKENKK